MTGIDVALGALQDGEDVALLRDRHRDFYLELAERAGAHLRRGEQLTWLDMLDASHDNLIAALEWSIARGDADGAQRMVGALRFYWQLRLGSDEIRSWAER